MTQRLELTSLVGGLAVAALGGLMLLDNLGSIDLGFAYLAPAVTATLGAILVASGVSRSRRR